MCQVADNINFLLIRFMPSEVIFLNVHHSVGTTVMYLHEEIYCVCCCRSLLFWVYFSTPTMMSTSIYLGLSLQPWECWLLRFIR